MAELVNDKPSKDGKANENEEVIYPVEEVSLSEAPSEENVKDAIDELNPTIDSLGQRG